MMRDFHIFTRKQEEASEVSLIPLINIIFLLLIFFMVSGTLRHSDRLPVALPKVSQADNKESAATEMYLIMTNGEMKIAINQDMVLLRDLNKIIKTLLQTPDNKEFVIKADQSLPAYRLIEMMDRLEALGVKSLLLATEVKG
jgi:biopolymer transport protein ExbD